MPGHPCQRNFLKKQLETLKLLKKKSKVFVVIFFFFFPSEIAGKRPCLEKKSGGGKRTLPTLIIAILSNKLGITPENLSVF
jgi:hypothetical protein